MQIKDSQLSQAFVNLLLPDEIFDYFKLVKVKTNETSIEIHLDELNHPPQEYSSEKLESKGFITASIIQDFPIRERAVYLHVRKRRWEVMSSGKIISKDWKMTAKGTRYTKSFALFLKEVFG